MAAHAIGDIEAILEASGVDEEEDDGSADGTAFAEKIRQLVVASLGGKNVEAATRLAEKKHYRREEWNSRVRRKNMSMRCWERNGRGSRHDSLPGTCPRATKSMEPDVFVLTALASLGTAFRPEAEGVYVSQPDGRVDRICFDEAHALNAVLCRKFA